MKKWLAILGLGVVVTAGATPLEPNELAALTPIDSVPTPNLLDTVVWKSTQEALTKLTTIAQDAAADNDPGARVRAIHALGKYCPLPPAVIGQPCTATDPGWPAHAALSTIISGLASQNVRAGTDLLMLRAAIEAIGPQEVQTDLAFLAPLLDHPSRDIRTATAHALRDLCNTNAVGYLKARYAQEPTDQVRLAISEALRSLPCPVN